MIGTEQDDIDLSDFNFDNIGLDNQNSSKDETDDALAQAFQTSAEENSFEENASQQFENAFNSTQDQEPIFSEQNEEESTNESDVDDFLNSNVDSEGGNLQENFGGQSEVNERMEEEFSDTKEDNHLMNEPFLEENSGQNDETPMFVSDQEGDQNSVDPISETQMSENFSFLRWYDGVSTEELFEVQKGFSSGRFEGNDRCKVIHVNVGYDSYGWSVQFTNGVIMNLRDVKEYQIRNGELPHPDGRIIYGQSVLDFSNVERIVVYESVKYFSYGA